MESVSREMLKKKKSWHQRRKLMELIRENEGSHVDLKIDRIDYEQIKK